jgi:N-acetylneuraminic acid mutarotase
VYTGKLYVVGGWDKMGGFETLRSVEVYDFATQQWSPLQALDRDGHGAVVCENKLYVVGGADDDGTTLDSVGVCDFATETWSILPAPMPQARYFITNAVLQHKGKVTWWVGLMGENRSRVWQCTTLLLKNGACCRLK